MAKLSRTVRAIILLALRTNIQPSTLDEISSDDKEYAVAVLIAKGLIEVESGGVFQLTPKGANAAQRMVAILQEEEQ